MGRSVAARDSAGCYGTITERPDGAAEFSDSTRSAPAGRGRKRHAALPAGAPVVAPVAVTSGAARSCARSATTLPHTPPLAAVTLQTLDQRCAAPVRKSPTLLRDVRRRRQRRGGGS